MIASAPMPDSPQMTFLLHDAGETRAILPVMRTLDRYGVNYRILAEDTARRMLADNPHLAATPGDVERLVRAHSAPVPPMQMMNNHWTLAHLRNSLDDALQAPCIVTGMASDFQKSLALQCKALGKRVVGYYDAFGFYLAPNRNKADEFTGALSELVTASQPTANFFGPRLGLPPDHVKALGQPALETAASAAQGVNRILLREELGLDPVRPTLLFVGGYGPGYQEALALFCQAVQQLAQQAALPSVVPPGMSSLHAFLQGMPNVLLSLHPSATGRMEAAMLQQAGLIGMVKILPPDLSTQEALAVSDGVLGHASTVLMQAAVLGKPVIPIGPVAPDYADPLSPFLPRCLQSEHFLTALASTLSHAAENQTQPLNPALIAMRQARFGIPANATEAITRHLLTPVAHTPTVGVA